MLFDNAVINALDAAAKTTGETKEIGGLLLGYRKEPHLHITKPTFPGRSDISQRYKFIRQDISHQIVALTCWIKSGRKTGWAGEWHTHPEFTPTPSGADITSWKKLVTHTNEPMVFLIIGTSGKWVGLMMPDTHELIKLDLLEQSERGLLFG